MKLINKIAIVTGGGRGLGQAIALTLAKEGANVVVGDINHETAINVANQIEAMGRQALAIKVDVTNSGEVGQMTEMALKKWGKIDILVNNAGGSARERASLFHESTEEIWDFVIGRNLKGTLICTKAVITHMMERRSGKIVNIASAAALRGEPGLADYSAAKAGVIAFTKALAKEVGSYGINVNSIAPGATETPALLEIAKSPVSIEEIKKNIVLGRLGKPEDIANMVLFLVSDESSFITGQNHVVCGGGFI